MTSFNFASTHRDDQTLAALHDWNQTISDENRLLKYSKMVCSPLVFFRGTNHFFWRDFANHPELDNFGNTQTKIWIQGDLHPDNFGSFHNDENRVIYGLNDFDEAVIADYQYDIWRMAIGLVLVTQQHKDFKKSDQKEFIEQFCLGYLRTISAVVEAESLSDLEFTKQNTYGKLDDFLKEVEESESRQDMLDKWTNVQGGDRYYDLSSDKLAPATEAERQEILGQMPEYGKTLTGGLEYDPKYFRVKDIARRLLAGTGSLGVPRFYIVIEGDQDHHKYDCILDVKYQGKPTPYKYLGKAFQKDYDKQFENDAQRQAIAYKALVKNTDEHLGWLKLDDDFYSVRERSPYKEAFPLDILTSKKRFTKLAEQWGKILATSHCHSNPEAPDQSTKSFAETVHRLAHGEARKAEFCQLVQKVAFNYAHQTKLDWQAFKFAHPALTCFE
ncbi:MAG: DUF2252 family protein [Limnothrix sp.]